MLAHTGWPKEASPLSSPRINAQVYSSMYSTDAQAWHHPARAYGARAGAGIGKFVGAFVTPKALAQAADSNSKDYQCRQNGKSCKMGNLKRNMVSHLSLTANKKCLELYSESGDKREMVWVRLVHQH